MNKNFSDEDLDQILKRIVKDSAFNEAAIDEIADSPQLWWNVQRTINQEKSSGKKGLFPAWSWRIAAFASLALIFCIGLIWFSVNSGKNDSIAQTQPVEAPLSEPANIDKEAINPAPKSEEDAPETTSRNILTKRSPANITPAKFKPKSNVSPKTQKAAHQPKSFPETVTGEIKTDFIALSYSSAPESGQILKVKVPRSMMVSLGVAANMDNNSQLVNAEVVLGDDGLARAIRFVQ